MPFCKWKQKMNIKSKLISSEQQKRKGIEIVEGTPTPFSTLLSQHLNVLRCVQVQPVLQV